ALGGEHDEIDVVLRHVLVDRRGGAQAAQVDLLDPDIELLEHRGARAAGLETAPGLERAPDGRELRPLVLCQEVATRVEDRELGLAQQRDRERVGEGEVTALGEVGGMEDGGAEGGILHGGQLAAGDRPQQASSIERTAPATLPISRASRPRFAQLLILRWLNSISMPT